MIGLFRKRIDILSQTRIDDGAGGASLSWAPIEAAWAGVERLASTRDFAGDRRTQVRRIAATIRWRASAMPGRRIRLEARDYEIMSVESLDDKERRVVLVCEEVLS